MMSKKFNKRINLVAYSFVGLLIGLATPVGSSIQAGPGQTFGAGQPVGPAPVFPQAIPAQPQYSQPVYPQAMPAQTVASQPAVGQTPYMHPIPAQPIFKPAVSPQPLAQPVFPQTIPVQPVIPQPSVPQPVTSQPYAIPSNIHFYSAIYSFDDGFLNMPRNAHSFAAFIAYDHAAGRVAERFSISWVPADGTVRIFEGLEMGHNRPLWQTQDYARNRGFEIRRWGPREITPELYMAARQQWYRLERAQVDGSILYVALDDGHRQRAVQPAMNCIHAITSVAGDLVTADLRGRRASEEIDRFFKPFYRSMQSVYEVHQAFLNFEEGR